VHFFSTSAWVRLCWHFVILYKCPSMCVQKLSQSRRASLWRLCPHLSSFDPAVIYAFLLISLFCLPGFLREKCADLSSGAWPQSVCLSSVGAAESDKWHLLRSSPSLRSETNALLWGQRSPAKAKAQRHQKQGNF